MSLPSFTTLWNNHPIVKSNESHPCRQPDGSESFSNECAMKLGVALQTSGVDISSWKVAKCWFHAATEGHFLRAQELAEWIKDKESALFGTAEIKKKADNITHADYSSKTGLIFFKDFWQRPNQRDLQGDHIDFWNKTQMCSGSNDYFTRSAEVWFWEIS